MRAAAQRQEEQELTAGRLKEQHKKRLAAVQEQLAPSQSANSLLIERAAAAEHEVDQMRRCVIQVDLLLRGRSSLPQHRVVVVAGGELFLDCSQPLLVLLVQANGSQLLLFLPLRCLPSCCHLLFIVAVMAQRQRISTKSCCLRVAPRM